jgi:hypothetical protein
MSPWAESGAIGGRSFWLGQIRPLPGGPCHDHQLVDGHRARQVTHCRRSLSLAPASNIEAGLEFAVSGTHSRASFLVCRCRQA